MPIQENEKENIMESRGKVSKAVLPVSFIGILAATVLFVAGCEMENCRGDGNCHVTVGQGGTGLFVDNALPRSTCGNAATFSAGSWTGGCRVQNNIANPGGVHRTFGTHSCNC